MYLFHLRNSFTFLTVSKPTCGCPVGAEYCPLLQRQQKLIFFAIPSFRVSLRQPGVLCWAQQCVCFLCDP